MSLKAGVIGCGNICKFHFSGLEKAGVKIKRICDLDRERAQPWLDKYEAEFTEDYMEIVNDDEIDVINITPFSSLHKQMCLAAINAGKAVICEKTLTENAQDSYEVVKCAQDKETIFYTSYMKRFIPAVEKAKELLPSLGEIITTHIRAYQPWGNIWLEHPAEGFSHTPTDGGMSGLRRNYGGGILVCGGSHILDLTCFLLGRPHRLYAKVYTPEGRDYDLQATAFLETDNGVVHYDTIAHPLKKIGFNRDGWDEGFEIIGTHGRLRCYSAKWDQCEILDSFLVHYDNESGTETEHRFNPVSPFDRAIKCFCDNIAKGEQGEQSKLTGYDVDELIEHFFKSSDTGQAVDVNWKL